MNKSLPGQLPKSAPSDTGKDDRLFVTALARGLTVLRCFTPIQRELNITEIARLTGLPQPTVWRLCHTLTELGYLIESPRRDKLQLGTGVLALGYSALANFDAYTAFKPHMQAIADKYEAAVSLAARDGLQMVFVQRCHGDSMLRMNLHVGSRIQMINSSLGWAHLAALDTKARTALSKALAESDPAGWQKIEAPLTQALQQYKETGYLLNIGGFRSEINALAMPIVSYDGSNILSLNCSGFASMVSPQLLEKEIAPQLLDIADTIRMSVGRNSDM